MSARGYWIAFAIGVSAGAAVALLYAPQTGTRTRRQLRHSLDDTGNYLDDAGNYLKAQAEKLAQETQSALTKAKAGVSDAVETASSKADAAIKQAKSLV